MNAFDEVISIASIAAGPGDGLLVLYNADSSFTSNSGRLEFQICRNGNPTSTANHAEVDHAAAARCQRVSISHVVMLGPNEGNNHSIEVDVKAPSGTTAEVKNQFLQVFVFRALALEEQRLIIRRRRG